MQPIVPDEVLAKTTKCPSDFSCLETGACGDVEKCRVDQANGENVLFLASRKYVNCPYRIHYGGSIVCTCPTHYAIYKQFSET
ncbi:MAG: hypothetical protein GXP53_07260 [Deltaproteobacteria bacterium]|nr:hypothetical protein [Deltaproteobacteria bacterium]